MIDWSKIRTIDDIFLLSDDELYDEAPSIDELPLELNSELTEQEIKEHPVRVANKMALIRAQRDKLLKESDYLMLSDAPGSESCIAGFKSYRQALRDLPDNVSDVDSVSWPQKPSYEKKIIDK